VELAIFVTRRVFLIKITSFAHLVITVTMPIPMIQILNHAQLVLIETLSELTLNPNVMIAQQVTIALKRRLILFHVEEVGTVLSSHLKKLFVLPEIIVMKNLLLRRSAHVLSIVQAILIFTLNAENITIAHKELKMKLYAQQE